MFNAPRNNSRLLTGIFYGLFVVARISGARSVQEARIYKDQANTRLRRPYALQFLIILLSLLIVMAALCPVRQVSAAVLPDFEKLFDEHGAVMMLIDPQTGTIAYANKAAIDFYGYGQDELLSMNISQINILTPDAISAEMEAAVAEQRNYFEFQHRLANGDIRYVEVFSYPTEINGHQYLFSIVQDTTVKTLLEQQQSRLTAAILIGGSAFIVLLIVLSLLLLANRGRLKRATREIENFNSLREVFMNASNSMIYLKDQNRRYLFINEAFAGFYKVSAEKVVGRTDQEIFEPAFAQLRGQSDDQALQANSVIREEVSWQGRWYQFVKFPVTLRTGKTGIGAYINDITDEVLLKHRQEMALHRNNILLDVFSLSFKNVNEQIEYILHRTLDMTGSQYGYIFMYDELKAEFTLNSWTAGVMADCRLLEQLTRYPLESTGLWGEVVRQRRPIVVNEYTADNPMKKGFPPGHVQLARFMSVPVMIDDEIVAVIGLANKADPYDKDDIYEVTLLMSGAWQAFDRHRALDQLSFERNKYLQTLISIGDGVMVVDHKGNIEMLNVVGEKLTGWPYTEARGRHYHDVFKITGEDPDRPIEDPIAAVLTRGVRQEFEHPVVMLARNGQVISLEFSAAPIPGELGGATGVVLVFRDATEKMAQQREIRYLSFHDSLTGLYNRRFFEEELTRIDTSRNLPIAVVMGDVNGLKLTNDVFGHQAGDDLLRGIAEVMRRVCRTDDIIARWGGDEFVMLLPATSAEEAAAIISRVKDEFSRQQFLAIQGSISMGADCKTHLSADMATVMKNAEEAMYLNKTLERDQIRHDMISTILARLYSRNPREREHAENVSALCEAFGRRLGLPADDVRKLKDAGLLHDIGKVVLPPEMLKKNFIMSAEERNEVRKHPTVGFRILNSFDETIDLAEDVLAHHEHWDGSGYPKGLSGLEIPLMARIISLAECYDRLVSGEEARDALDTGAAIGKLRELAGMAFDKEMAENFAQMLEDSRPA